MSSTLASIVDADESGGLGPSAPPTRSLRSRVGITDDERACGAGATSGRSMPLAALAAMTRCRFAAWMESGCAGAGGAIGVHGFVVCIVAACAESCCVGAFGAAKQKHGFVAFLDGRGLRPHRGATRRSHATKRKRRIGVWGRWRRRRRARRRRRGLGVAPTCLAALGLSKRADG
jgi:hypothetical protein